MKMNFSTLFSSVLLMTCIAVFSANAEIVYHDIDPDTTIVAPNNGGRSYYLDLDSNGELDFGLKVILRDYGANVTIGCLLQKNAVCGSGDTNHIENFYPLCLSEGELITKSADYIWYNKWDHQWGHEWDMSIAGYGLNGDGHWAEDNVNKYIGVRFLSNGSCHYGWIALEIPEAEPSSFTIKGFAYETEADVAIAAGATSSSGITTETACNELTIYPNPASEFILIDMPEIISTDNYISIYDGTGKKIACFNQNELIGKNSLHISTETFASGLYYCVLNTNQGIITKTFIVAK